MPDNYDLQTLIFDLNYDLRQEISALRDRVEKLESCIALAYVNAQENRIPDLATN